MIEENLKELANEFNDPEDAVEEETAEELEPQIAQASRTGPPVPPPRQRWFPNYRRVTVIFGTVCKCEALLSAAKDKYGEKL